MKRLTDMECQIEITNACVLQCANCTRFCGHHVKPYFMSREQVTAALQSLEKHPKLVGIMGGEPLLHPDFEWICEEARKYFPREQLGLWTGLPHNDRFLRYRTAIVETFYSIFINDHSRGDIYHAPLLVSAKSVYDKKYPDDPVKAEREMWNTIDNCWVQNSWSKAINPKGAFFCEVAAAQSILYDGPEGWKIEKDWWTRSPRDYREQMEQWCPGCGAACSLKRRVSTDERDDISPDNLERLKAVGSRKVKHDLYQISDLQLVEHPEEMAKYKDTEWRNQVASRYGMFLTINSLRYWEPHLKPRWDPTAPKRVSLFEEIKAGVV